MSITCYNNEQMSEPEEGSVSCQSRQIERRSRPPITKPSRHFFAACRIRGYKSIEFCDVELRPLTVLVGRNASGKSNFVDALSFLTVAMETSVVEAARLHGGADSLLFKGGKSSRIQIEIETEFPSQGKTCRADYSISLSVDKKLGSIRVDGEVLRIRDSETDKISGFDVRSGRTTWIGPNNFDQKSFARVSASFGEGKPSGKVHYYPYPFKEFRPDRLLLAVIGSQPFIDLAQRLRASGFYNFYPEAIRQPQRVDANPKLQRDGRNLARAIEALKEIDKKRIERIASYLSVITDGIYKFEIVRIDDFETIHFRQRLVEGGKSMVFNAASMSDGTLRALATLVAAFQIALPVESGIVAIEEPETSLHPSAMRALVDALDEATTDNQILVTTHSADLLDGRDISPGQVLVVRNRDGRTLIAPVDAGSREIVEKELNTLAGLQRIDRLDLDETDLERQANMSNGAREPTNMPLRVVVVVEGHGEDGAVRTLLTRIWYELLDGDAIEVIPWRCSQGRLLKKETLKKDVEQAAIKLHNTNKADWQRLLLIMIDSEGDCPAKLGQKLLAWAKEFRADTEIACVMPNPMFETWFAAAATSLRGKNDLPSDIAKPDDPEAQGLGKGWIKKHLPRKYKETVDQPRFVGQMSLSECRDSSRSFRKLCQELTKRRSVATS